MKEKYIEDLKEIKEMMNRSTRFITLSGLSGVFTGITALAGVYIAYKVIFKENDFLTYHAINFNMENIKLLLLIALGTLIISIGLAIFFTNRKTKKQNRVVWDKQLKNLLINFLIPLIAGGILCLMLLFKGFIGLLAPLSLLFYGLALVNASKYTFSEIRYLGLIEISLGLIAVQYINYSLLIWAFGFGIIQIIYGLIIQRKY